jgi:amino acid transporter
LDLSTAQSPLFNAVPLSDYIGGWLASSLGYQSFDFVPSLIGFAIGVVMVVILALLLFLGIRKSARFYMKPSILKLYQEGFTT